MSPAGANGKRASRPASTSDDRADLDARTREMRHRFRNSLQFLNSLVGLHSRQVKDPDARRTFKDLRTRLVTVSWIFDNVDSYTDEQIPLAEFLPRLTRHVLSVRESRVQCSPAFAIAELSIDAQRASSLAQILAELVGSALHSAPPQCTILIQVQRSTDNEHGELTVGKSWDAVAGDDTRVNDIARILVESLAQNISGELLEPTAAGGGWGVRWPLRVNS